MTHRDRRLHKAQTFYNNPEDELKEAVINASILAGFAFFETLAGVAISGLLGEPLKCLLAATIAAGIAFFGRLMYERGIERGR